MNRSESEVHSKARPRRRDRRNGNSDIQMMESTNSGVRKVQNCLILEVLSSTTCRFLMCLKGKGWKWLFSRNDSFALRPCSLPGEQATISS